MYGITISVPITRDYKVLAMQKWDNDNKHYLVSLYLKRNDVDILDLMGKAKNIEIKSDIKKIKADIAKYITQLYEEKFFCYYIDRFEYMMKCFDAGNEFFYKESLDA